MQKVAIVIGHTPSGGGAHNSNSQKSEYDFNNILAPLLADSLRRKNILPIILYRETYTLLPQQVNDTKADLCISLHCNASNKKTVGAEVLYHHSSKNGKKLAKLIVDQVAGCLGENNRGAKPIDYKHTGSKGDKGGWLVEKTAMPTVIVEPFFIDNDKSLQVATEKRGELANVIASAIKTYLNERLKA